jgi:hypothetical protein
MSDYVSSDFYRASSQEEEVHSAQLVRDYTPSAQQYASDHNVSLEEALNKVLSDDGHNADETLWTGVPLDENDSSVGTVIKGKKITLVCNSVLTDMYNDTFAAEVTGDTSTFVTYRNLKSYKNIHSGDIHTPYCGKGLRHKIQFTDEGRDVNTTTFILSAPWISSRKDLVSNLIKTRPILEIRVDNDGKLERFIVPQDFSSGGQSTACACAMVTWDGEYWTVKILREFINGFADDVNTSISDLKKLEFDKVPCVSHDDVPSIYYDDTPSVSHDTVPMEFNDDQVFSVLHQVVSSIGLDEFTVVSNDNFQTSDYVTEF